MNTPVRLRVDWSACDGHGLCAQWAPELIELDEWGYPIVAAGPVPREAIGHAKAASRSCPALALTLLRPA